ncbi:SGNH/GDSL hydrolase family protein [Rhizobium puerariae]|uniref:SGNH/GDSL hydrolase family protein n=1 Tax=Rhizobium puerariae TaxID=1585791 RepID=A0ABV6AI40_9HYPH
MVTTRSFRDSAVLASMPIIQGVGRKWGFMGDSHTVGSGAPNSIYGFAAQSCILAGRLQNVDHALAGIGGQTTDQMLARFKTDIIDAGCDGVVILGGTNDSAFNGVGVPVATFIGNIVAMLQLARAYGIRAIVCTVPPTGAGAGDLAIRSKLIEAYNLWLKLAVHNEGARLADIHSALVDPATGQTLAAYNADGIHFTALGHLAIAEVVAPIMQAMNMAATLGVDAPPVAGGTCALVANPLMNGTVGTGNSPTGWFTQQAATGSVTRGVRARSGTLQKGQWFEAALDGTSVAASVIYGLSLGGTYAGGDKLGVTCRMEIEDTAGNWRATRGGAQQGSLSLNVNNGGANLNNTWRETGGLAVPPSMYVVTANASSGLALWWKLAVVAGQNIKARIGEVQVYNLTAMGLDGVIAG